MFLTNMEDGEADKIRNLIPASTTHSSDGAREVVQVMAGHLPCVLHIVSEVRLVCLYVAKHSSL